MLATNIASTTTDRLAKAWRVLSTVTDPEIPVLSIVDLGIVADVRIEPKGLTVDLTPTFVGCPALTVIRESITSALGASGETTVDVRIVYDPPWTTDRMSDEGRRKLREFGVAPPSHNCPPGLSDLNRVTCPFCDSMETELDSIFGPTLCRSIHYCKSCLQSFEHFKQLSN